MKKSTALSVILGVRQGTILLGVVFVNQREALESWKLFHKGKVAMATKKGTVHFATKNVNLAIDLLDVACVNQMKVRDVWSLLLHKQWSEISCMKYKIVHFLR